MKSSRTISMDLHSFFTAPGDLVVNNDVLSSSVLLFVPREYSWRDIPVYTRRCGRV